MPPRDAAGPGDSSEAGTNLLTGGHEQYNPREAELATIGALILAADEIRREILAIVQPTDFSDPWCLFISWVIGAMVAEGVPVDEVTVAGFIDRHALLSKPRAPRFPQGVRIWLHDTVSSAPVPAAGGYYATLVLEQSARRRMHRAGVKLTQIAGEGALVDLRSYCETEIRDVLDRLERAEKAVGR